MTSVFKSPQGREIVLGRYRKLLADWPVPNRQHRVQTRHGEVFVIDSGPTDAPPLLLLHGTAANTAGWMLDVPVWAQSFRVISPDIIGDAGQSAETRPAFGSGAHREWIADVLSALEIGKVAVVGMSLGGWLALDFATAAPERVERLVLLSPGGVGPTRNILLWALPLLLLGSWGRVRMLERIGGKRAPQNQTEQALFDLSDLIFQHFKPRSAPMPPISDDLLGRLTMPVLAILGGRDVFIDAEATRDRLTALLPDVTVRFLSDAPHVVPGQTEAIHRFLQGRPV